jgi:DNA topoisomerase VI subunit B
MTALLHRSTFRTSRLLDFASEKELVAQTGHASEQWPLVVLKGLVDNAVDACEEAGIPPVISVAVDGAGITVADNGPGLPASTIEGVLDFSVRVSSREAYVSPTRGAQGNALKTIVAMPFVLDGEQGRVEIETRGVRYVIDFGVDRIRQEPTIELRREPADRTIGTAITLKWPDSACSVLTEAEDRFLQIAADYAWLNPHASIRVDWFGRQWGIQATDPSWSKWKPSDPTSPHWYTPAQLERLVAGYLAHDADAGRERTVREFVAEFRGFSGSAKQKAVLEATGLSRAPLSRLMNGNGIDRGAVERLLAAMRTHSKPVKPEMLGLIRREHFRTRFEALGCEMESFDYRRVAEIEGGVPYVLETAFAWRPEAAARRLVTGVNWSPGIMNPFRQLGRFGASLDTVLARQYANRDEPVVLVLHIACPRVEYTDRGKSAVVVS